MSNNAQAFNHPLVHKDSVRSGRVLDAIAAANTRPGPGALSTPMPGGAVITPLPRARSSAAAHAWQGGPAGNSLIRVAGGSYNSLAVEAQTDIAGSGWVYLAAEWELTTEDDYIVAATLVQVGMFNGSVVPENEGPFFYVPLLQYDAGRIVSQVATRAISAVVCDAGLGDGTPMHTILQS